MSTNIRIDVLLKRLQEQATQVLSQNRQELQDREASQRQQQQQTAQAKRNARSPKDQPLAAQRKDSTAEHSSVPDTYKKRHPAAQRGGTSITGIQYSYLFQQPKPETRKLTVGLPGLQVKAEYTFAQFPDTTVNTNIPLPPDAGGFAALGIWNGTDPTSAVRTTYGFYNTEKYYDLSLPLCLPLNQNATIFVWDYHYAKHQLISRLEMIDTSASVNQRTNSYGQTIFDRDNEYLYNHTLDNDDFQVVRETVCFLIAPNGVRQLNVPDPFKAALYDRRPLASKTGVTPIFLANDFQILEEYNNGLVDNVVTRPQANTYQYVPGFEYAEWRPEYTGPGQALAMQFGLGEMLSIPHSYLGRNYFSGGVYQWLTEPMDLSTNDSNGYSNVRQQLKNFPGRYFSVAKGVNNSLLPPSAGDGFVIFGLARAAPTFNYVPMSESNFTWSSRYSFPSNDAPPDELAYCWNWDNEQYCRRKLVSLGFTAADFSL